MLRPLFLEFPNAAPDRHPIDLDARGQFLWGPDLLIAAPPFFEIQNTYSPVLPGPIWYDFWTGHRVLQKGSLRAAATETGEYNSATRLPEKSRGRPAPSAGLGPVAQMAALNTGA